MIIQTWRPRRWLFQQIIKTPSTFTKTIPLFDVENNRENEPRIHGIDEKSAIAAAYTEFQLARKFTAGKMWQR